jgi:AGZA family xanthine/uracil permease-like MFS transporter
VVAVVLIFVFLDLFDTMGTLVGLSHQAGLVRDDGSIPGDRAVYVADAAGTLVGAAMGTSTVTSYVESAAGIAEGGRTGLTGITAGILFLVSLFLYPLVKMVGMGLPQESGAVLYPVIAPVLIVIGGLMMKSVRAIDWEDPVVALPSFLTIILMPLTFSITEGIGFGFMACSALALLSGRWREVPPVFHAFSTCSCSPRGRGSTPR